MPPIARSQSAAAPGRLRRFALLELPGWAILAVSVAYTTYASGSTVTFFQVVLLSSALAWLFGGRIQSLPMGSLLFGWAAGSLAWFNFLVTASIGIFLLPVTLFVVAVLVLLLSARNLRCRTAALGGVLLAIATQVVFLGSFLRH